MSWLMGLIPGGELTIWASLATALFAVAAYLFKSIRQSGVDAQKVKEAKAREYEIERIKRAAGTKPSDSVSDDPNNRDNWKT